MKSQLRATCLWEGYITPGFSGKPGAGHPKRRPLDGEIFSAIDEGTQKIVQDTRIGAIKRCRMELQRKNQAGQSCQFCFLYSSQCSIFFYVKKVKCFSKKSYISERPF
jgi:hypothetical protein